MNQMNQIIIEGNVVRSAQVKEFGSGKKLCQIPIAVNRSYKGKDGNYEQETSFFDVEAWGEGFCTMLAKNAVKGRGLRVVGRLKQNRWKTEEGKTESRILILADHVEFKPQKKEDVEENAKKEYDENAPSSNSDEMENLAECAAGIREETEAVF